MSGKLTENTRDGKVFVTGYIATYKIKLDFRLEVNANRADDKSPTHKIMGRGEHGDWFEAGAAWQGTSNRGERYYSLAFNIPEIWDTEMRYAAWEDGNGGFDIRYSKPKETPQQANAAA